jgi:flagellar hook-basal body complex protein FliE
MSVAEIAAVDAAAQAQAPMLRAQATDPSGSAFATWLAQGIENINGSLLKADAALAQGAVDGSQPPHQVMLALEEARLSFQLALQVRNRLLEGYQELMRMQV